MLLKKEKKREKVSLHSKGDSFFTPSVSEIISPEREGTVIEYKILKNTLKKD